MSLPHSSLKLIYGAGAFVSKFLAFVIVFLVRHPNLSDPDSSAFVHILPRAESDIGGSYPYASLVAVIVFAALTLFEFIRDSIAIMDESILQTWDLRSHRRAPTPSTDCPANLPYC
jgi:hypothetical protein